MQFVEGGETLWQQGLAKNQDPYSACIYRYAQAWAELMEQRLTGATSIASVAEQSSHDADTEGITGFMYGCAVGILAACWIYGEALRRWHNVHTQISDEGDRANETGNVLNPAVLILGTE